MDEITKLKTIKAIIFIAGIILIFVILGVFGEYLIDNIGSGLMIFLSIIYVLSLRAIVYSFENKINNLKHKEYLEEKERKEKVIKKKKEDLRNKYLESKKSFLEIHGNPDKNIILNNNNIDSEIFVFENTRKIFILGKEYNFDDIISCNISDNPTIKKGKTFAVTQSNNKNTIGRAVVGNLIAGGAGAIIGGATAKRETNYISGNDYTIHDYTVIINVNDLSDPIIKINTGRNEDLTNEIAGLINVIISRK